MKNQVTSLELAKKLKELGVNQDSYWSWYNRVDHEGWYVDLTSMRYDKKFSNDLCAAHTVTELGELLPELCLSGKASKDYYNCWWFEEMCLRELKHYNTYQAEKEADARATMLIWLIEEGKL